MAWTGVAMAMVRKCSSLGYALQRDRTEIFIGGRHEEVGGVKDDSQVPGRSR